jgi:hypothetical protein
MVVGYFVAPEMVYPIPSLLSSVKNALLVLQMVSL